MYQYSSEKSSSDNYKIYDAGSEASTDSFESVPEPTKTDLNSLLKDLADPYRSKSSSKRYAFKRNGSHEKGEDE